MGGFYKDMYEGMTGFIKTRTMRKMSTRHDKTRNKIIKKIKRRGVLIIIKEIK